MQATRKYMHIPCACASVLVPSLRYGPSRYMEVQAWATIPVLPCRSWLRARRDPRWPKGHCNRPGAYRACVWHPTITWSPCCGRVPLHLTPMGPWTNQELAYVPFRVGTPGVWPVGHHVKGTVSGPRAITFRQRTIASGPGAIACGPRCLAVVPAMQTG